MASADAGVCTRKGSTCSRAAAAAPRRRPRRGAPAAATAPAGGWRRRGVVVVLVRVVLDVLHPVTGVCVWVGARQAKHAVMRQAHRHRHVMSVDEGVSVVSQPPQRQVAIRWHNVDKNGAGACWQRCAKRLGCQSGCHGSAQRLYLTHVSLCLCNTYTHATHTHHRRRRPNHPRGTSCAPWRRHPLPPRVCYDRDWESPPPPPPRRLEARRRRRAPRAWLAAPPRRSRHHRRRHLRSRRCRHPSQRPASPRHHPHPSRRRRRRPGRARGPCQPPWGRKRAVGGGGSAVVKPTNAVAVVLS